MILTTGDMIAGIVAHGVECQVSDEMRDWLKTLPIDGNPLVHRHPQLAEWTCWYASDIMGERWMDAESIIMTDALSAYVYSSSVMQSRWEVAESVIMACPSTAAHYAQYVIKGRWVDAEKTIRAHRPASEMYDQFIGSMSDETE